MTYEKFKKYLEAKLKEELTGYAISFEKNMKVNSFCEYLCIKEWADTSVLEGFQFDLAELFQTFLKREDFEKIVEMIKESIKITRPEAQNFGKDLLSCPSDFLITFQAINAEFNKEFLKEVPHITMCDLALICRLTKEGSEGIYSTVLTNRLLQKFGWSKEKLFTEKWLGTNALLEFETLDVSFGAPFNLYAVTNKAKLNGAACIFFPTVLEQARKKLGYDFYIILSSIHEILLIEKDLEEVEAYKKMIKAANQNREVVAENEILSYNLYEFVNGRYKTKGEINNEITKIIIHQGIPRHLRKIG